MSQTAALKLRAYHGVFRAEICDNRQRTIRMVRQVSDTQNAKGSRSRYSDDVKGRDPIWPSVPPYAIIVVGTRGVTPPHAVLPLQPIWQSTSYAAAIDLKAQGIKVVRHRKLLLLLFEQLMRQRPSFVRTITCMI
jgi:hypothetical protein